MDWSKERQMEILERFFNECLRYWERTLKVDSDTDKQAYINAIEDIPHYNPYSMQGKQFDEEVRSQFRKYRLMDCYGTKWEQYM